MKILRDSFFHKIRTDLVGQTTSGKLVDDKGKVLLNKGAVLDLVTLDSIPRKYWGEIPLEKTAKKCSKNCATSKTSCELAKSTSATKSIV